MANATPNLRKRIQKIAAKVCHREGHKSQARILDVVEVIGILEDLRYEDADTAVTLKELGIYRAKKRENESRKEA